MGNIVRNYRAWRRSGSRSRTGAAIRAGLPFTVAMIVLQLVLSTEPKTALLTSLAGGVLLACFGALSWEPPADVSADTYRATRDHRSL